MNRESFEKFLQDCRRILRDKSDSEKIRVYIDWSNKNRLEEAILRLSSETKGGWSSNYYLDFTTSRIIITKKNILTKFADLGYVAGLGPYPYLVLMKDFNSSKIRKQASITPDDLVKSENFSDFIWYSNIEGLLLRKGIDTVVANMFGRAIVSNFLSIKTTVGKTYDFTLPVNKNGSYEQILFWLSVSLPPNCRPLEDTKL